ncbi:CRISPR-associated protein Cas5 [Candidatus Methanoperedens nitroreducens]|uniref:CRISPR-associated protein Cas5 n=2 Tax=Candidatus Methanoperedens nitratireducens TaxID=1392998 RepID=A0A062V9I3_9EURY|nr:CRISPR-associated protein Cas5 [Candidatus Methanoperedens nitroreducens]MDJ1422834.1 CRISPR-associated protein Cas5 [Candidatus Methanoperedens sp.]
MLGLKFRLEGLYFTTFRKPTSTSLIISYSIPPYTTIRGLIANASGLKRDDYSVQDWVRIGIKPLNFSDRSREMAKMLKLKGTGETHQKIFPSSPMFKEFLVSPSYEIYIAGEDDKINRIYNALFQPARSLYIGASDDLADIELSKPVEIEEVNAKEIYGVIEGVHENCLLENIPYKFFKKGKDFALEYKTVSIPQSDTLSLSEDVKCWRFDGDNIWLV